MKILEGLDECGEVGLARLSMEEVGQKSKEVVMMDVVEGEELSRIQSSGCLMRDLTNEILRFQSINQINQFNNKKNTVNFKSR